MDPFEVKSTDSLDHDLGIAGDDIDELFTAIHEEFGTHFSQLHARFDLYFHPEFHPEVAAISGTGYATLLAISGLVGAVYAALHAWLPQIVNLLTVIATLAVAVTIRLVVHNLRQQPFTSNKLRLTLDDIVHAVVAGKWSPPQT